MGDETVCLDPKNVPSGNAKGERLLLVLVFCVRTVFDLTPLALLKLRAMLRKTGADAQRLKWYELGCVQSKSGKVRRRLDR